MRNGQLTRSETSAFAMALARLRTGILANKNAGHVVRAGACQGILAAVKVATGQAVATAAVRFHQTALHQPKFFPMARTGFQFERRGEEIPAGNSLRPTRRS